MENVISIVAYHNNMSIELSVKNKKIVIIDGKKYLEVITKDGRKILQNVCQ